MKRIFLLMVVLFPLTSQAVPRLGYVTFGPMVHWNFSNNEFKLFSYGLEVSYWNYERKLEDEGWFQNMPDLKIPGYGLDLGLDIDRQGVRLYAEPQLGWGFAGVSFGPVLELPSHGGATRLGVQGSSWVNFVFGIDLRYRRLGGTHYQAMGLNGKLGYLISGADDTL